MIRHRSFMITILLLLLMLAAIIFLPKKNTSLSNLVKVERKQFSSKLYFTGVIQPAKTKVITSPADGVIVDMPFQYGRKVKQDQLLFTLASTKFLSDYKTALLQFIKAKNDFNEAKTQLREAEFLHKNQLISDDNFKSKKSAFYSARLALLQAKDTLQDLIRQVDLKDNSIYQLSIADIDKITEAMHAQRSSENLHVISSTSGTVLSPLKNEEDNKKLHKGDLVKQGDVLAIIGDMTSVMISVKVNELTVNQLKEGQAVKVSGMAFPHIVLDGKISRIDNQGESSSGGMPVFSVEVLVPHLSEEHESVIHAGMSATIDIEVKEDPHLIIPVAAISHKSGTSYVRRINKTTKKIEEVSVTAGKTTPDSVAILSGLDEGDELVLSYPA